MATRVGFIGLGAMGLPMARLLAAQAHPVLTYDLDPGARDRAAAVSGITVGESPAQVAVESDVLFTCLPNDAILRAAYLVQGGIAAAVTDGAITVDCSTVSPAATRAVHDVLRDKGVRHLDASMLGSVPQAEAGEIGFVVGGDRAAFDAVAPLLDILGRFRSYAGPSGAGNRIKLIHQTLVAVNALAVAEAVALCLKTETDLDCFYDVVCGGGGFAYSRYFEKRVPRMRGGDFTPLFMLELMRKDVGLAHDLAADAGLEAPLLDQALRRFEAAEGQGWGQEDFSAVAHLYEAAIGRRFSGEPLDDAADHLAGDHEA